MRVSFNHGFLFLAQFACVIYAWLSAGDKLKLSWSVHNKTILFKMARGDLLFMTHPFKIKHIFLFKLHSYFYTVIPFVLILILNALLIHHLQVAQKHKFALKMTHNVTRNRRSLCITIIYLTMLFILLTAPFACLSKYTSFDKFKFVLFFNFKGGYFVKEMLSTDLTRSIFYLSMAIAFSHHASNFLILYLTNKKFKEEVQNMFKKCDRNAS